MYKENFDIVMPVQINLGIGNNHKQCYYHYVPILKTIAVLLKDPDILKFCSNSCNEYDNTVLSDIYSGNVVKKNNFFNINKNAIQIILYQDAFEVCNPLGASKKSLNLLVYIWYWAIYQLISDQKLKIYSLLVCVMKNMLRFLDGEML